MGTLLLFGVGTTGFSILTIASVGHEETWLLAGASALIVCLCLAWPATITLEDSGIFSRVWWKKAVAIPWVQVTGVERTPGGEVQVFGSCGESITFTRFHVDPFGFQAEVTRRAKLMGVLDGLAPPSLRR
jgi:hypothetical protein